MVLENHVVNILGSIYKKVDWKKMGNRSSYDVFEHRVEYSRFEQHLPEFIQKLCDKLSVQAPTYKTEEDEFLKSVDYCRNNEKQALHMLRSRGKLLTLLASKRAKELKV